VVRWDTAGEKLVARGLPHSNDAPSFEFATGVKEP